MKRILLVLLGIFAISTISAKTLHLPVAGSLRDSVFLDKDKIQSLEVSGIIDGRDFNFMRDSMPVLSTINISKCLIKHFPIVDTDSISDIAYILPTDTFNFKNKISLVSISLPENMDVIAADAFRGCQNLVEVKVPKNLKFIGAFAFDSCSNLERINIPNTIIGIWNCAFEGCKNLQSSIVLDSIGILGDLVFSGCERLKSVIINSKKISVIKTCTFFRCLNLSTVLLNCPIETIEDLAFFQCENLTTITFPKSLKSIGRHAFQFDNSLSSITIPSKVISIKEGAFMDCVNIEHIKMRNKIPVKLSENASVTAFGLINKNTCTLYVPKGSKIKYKSANGWNRFSRIVEY